MTPPQDLIQKAVHEMLARHAHAPGRVQLILIPDDDFTEEAIADVMSGFPMIPYRTLKLEQEQFLRVPDLVKDLRAISEYYETTDHLANPYVCIVPPGRERDELVLLAYMAAQHPDRRLMVAVMDGEQLATYQAFADRQEAAQFALAIAVRQAVQDPLDPFVEKTVIELVNRHRFDPGRARMILTKDQAQADAIHSAMAGYGHIRYSTYTVTESQWGRRHLIMSQLRELADIVHATGLKPCAVVPNHCADDISVYRAYMGLRFPGHPLAIALLDSLDLEVYRAIANPEEALAYALAKAKEQGQDV